jgi:hypothetical protein
MERENAKALTLIERKFLKTGIFHFCPAALQSAAVPLLTVPKLPPPVRGNDGNV